jgi:hypothetical protein
MEVNVYSWYINAIGCWKTISMVVVNLYKPYKFHFTIISVQTLVPLKIFEPSVIYNFCLYAFLPPEIFREPRYGKAVP